MPDNRKKVEKWWVVQHHDEMSVVQSAQRPDTKVEDGERMKVAHGPFVTRDEAEKTAQSLTERTLRFLSER